MPIGACSNIVREAELAGFITKAASLSDKRAITAELLHAVSIGFCYVDITSGINGETGEAVDAIVIFTINHPLIQESW